jgi:hypothetical protein
MCIIMLFNEAAATGYEISLKAIKDALKMDDDTLQKNIKSLMLKNFKLLEVRRQSITQQMESPAGGKQTPSI